jgi:hypothetical protein
MNVPARWMLTLALLGAAACPVDVTVPVHPEPTDGDDDSDTDDMMDEDDRAIPCDASVGCPTDAGAPFCNGEYCVECLTSSDCRDGEICEKDEGKSDWECDNPPRR